jgi:hypothetical protein
VLDGASAYYISFSAPGPFSFEGFVIQNMIAGGPALPASIALSNNGGTLNSNLTIRWNTFLNCLDNCIGGYVSDNILIDSNIFRNQSPANNGSGNNYSAINLYLQGHNVTTTYNDCGSLQGECVAEQPQTNAGDTYGTYTISHNLAQNVNLTGLDAGAFYWRDDGRMCNFSGCWTVYGNYVSNNASTFQTNSATRCYYADDKASWATVTGNVGIRCGSTPWQIHGGNNNVFTGNYWDISDACAAGNMFVGFYSSPVTGNFGMAGNVTGGNIIASSGCFPNGLYSVILTGGDALPTNNGNFYYSRTGSVIQPNYAGIIDSSPIILSGPGVVLPVPFGQSLFGTANTTAHCFAPDIAGTAVCGAAASGAVTVAAGASSVTVTSSAVTLDSDILVTFNSSRGTLLGVTCNTTIPALFGVTAQYTGSFVLSATSPTTNPACFNYFVIN